MSRKSESTVDRVVTHLATTGGSGVLGDVSRRLGLCGTLARALKTVPALAQFVAQEFCRNKASHRPQTRLTLTPLGVAYAQTLKPGFRPARLSLVDWTAQLAEMTEERVPAALKIARDRADGAQWRAAEVRRKEADRAREKKALARENRPKVKRGQSQWFKDNVVNDDAEPDTEKLNQPTYSPMPTPPTPRAPQPPMSDYAEYIRDTYRSPIPRPSTPTTATTGESRIDIIRRANIAGYPTRGGREVQLNSEWVSCEQWAAANPK
jgi:hypothetical protein